MNRRYFLKSGSIALASIGMSLSAPAFLQRVALANTSTGGKRKTRTVRGVIQRRQPGVAMANVSEFSIRAGKSSADLQGGFEAIYGKEAGEPLAGMGREMCEAVNYLKKANPAQYKPENGAEYPRN